ncbi:hypothetical protein N1851_012443 [Merluccius polli]|uniref:Uncharacterized protein n=1 Tax=Merluccius polli TaxID=89951 RepID=A0AA47MX00_MERPO|nr:hypothetical protein N1851_012443 [Merluccius polli]
MILLKEVFGSLSERQRSQIKDWVRQQVPQIYFNCTLKPKPVRTRPEPAAGNNTNNNNNSNHRITITTATTAVHAQ